MGILHSKSFGYLRNFSVGAIAAGAKSMIDISEDDIRRIEYLNVVDIINGDVVDIAVYLNGNPDMKIVVPANLNKAVNGTRFTGLQVENLDGAAATTAGAISVTVQKDLGLYEQIELGLFK